MFVVSDLVPPSHFVSSAQLTGLNRISSAVGTTQPLRRVNQGVTSGDPCSPGPWLALSQPQQEIKERRKGNQIIKMLHHDTVRGSSPVNAVSDHLGAMYVTVVICFSCLTFREHFVCRVSIAISPQSLENRWNQGREQWTTGCESEQRAEAERHRTETERLNIEVEALKKTAERLRGDIRDQDCIVNR